MEYLPEYVSETHNRNCGNVTIENLLTMTVPYAFEEWKEPLEQLCTSPDWVGFTLDMMRDERKPINPQAFPILYGRSPSFVRGFTAGGWDEYQGICKPLSV